MTKTAREHRKELRKQGLRFSRKHIPDDVLKIIKARQRDKEDEIKKQFSMESVVYMILRESALNL